ncbi:MAG: flagellar hook-basal body protein [Clostridia bacterium]|nr:flagellar hook-basal body protein [Clostridia bacterium]
MIQSRYTARSGLNTLQQRLDTIANNMANVGTVGYKASRADFKTLMFQELQRPVQPQEDDNLNRGVGTTLGATTRSFAAGTPTSSGYPLDFMLQGDGFFTVQDSDGQLSYTRDGTFALSEEGQASYLVTSDGAYVMGKNNQKINVAGANLSDIQVAKDGRVYIVRTDNTVTPPTQTFTQAGQLDIKKFMNRKGLEAVGANKFRQTENSGAPQDDVDTHVIQGYREGSNVDLAQEMTRLIRTQRVFSLVSSALTTADEMDHQANTIRG